MLGKCRDSTVREASRSILKTLPDSLPALENTDLSPSSVPVHPGPRLTLLLRRSPRLAAKYRGNKKSSLHRAQDLMCKKLKMARFASKAPHPLSCSLPLPSTATPAHLTRPPLHADETCPAPPLPPADATCPAPPPPPVDEAYPASLLLTSKFIDATRETPYPLTRDEILQIKASCGIVDTGTEASHSSQAPPNTDAV